MFEFIGKAALRIAKSLHVPGSMGNWYPIVREGFAGAWQQNIEIRQDTVLSYSAVYACMTLIASDIAKLGIKLVVASQGVWLETSNPAYSPVLRKPNPNQTRIQFVENWILSKLTNGNTYVLKVRDARGVVSQLRILDPCRVQPMISDNGDIFYQLTTDNFAGLEPEDQLLVPASEIIHDRFNCIFHPLVGVSPIYACGLAAMAGTFITENSAKLFRNGQKMPGILSAPGAIGDDTAARLKAHWEANYVGPESFGKVAVLGDGLKYESMAMTSADAQLIEQLKWTAETVCSTFHVPTWKVGVAAMPAYGNIQNFNIDYYGTCLQSLIEAMELCLDEGLGLPSWLGIEVDVDGLMRMDTQSLISALGEATTKGIMEPDEARRKLNLKPTKGGNAVYMQQQNFSLAALAKRDAGADPFGTATATPVAAPPAASDNSTADQSTVDANAADAAAKAVETDTAEALELLLFRLKSVQKEFEN
jgi:HK97 family phage portal protein